MVRKSDKQISIYLFISVIIFAFFADETSYMAQNIIVPYINITPMFLHLGITVIICALLFIFIKGKELVFDIIFLFLCARIVSSIIPLMYISEATESVGRVIVPIISALAYFIGRQYIGKVDNLVIINMVFVTILSLQTIYTVINMEVPHPIYYEQHVKIPLASSNLIAAYIVPIILLTLAGYNGKWFIKYFVIIISFIAVIASTSQGAILILCIGIYIYLFKKMNKVVKILSFIAISTFVMLGFLFLGSLNLSLSDLTHQRSDLFISDLSLWTEHIFLGNGMVYEGRGSGTHSILLDLLVQTGLIGFFLYFVPLILVLKRLIINKDKKIMSLKLYLIASFLHSMGETSYFNYSNDMLFWFFTGLLINQMNETKKC